MPDLITEMEINEISVVDEPGNEGARVVITKARSAGSGDTFPVADVARALMDAMDEVAPVIVEKAAASLADGDPEAADAAAKLIKELIMDFDELKKALEASEAKVTDLEKRVKDAETEKGKLADLLKAKEAELEKIEKAKDPEAAEAELLKSLPETIRKRLEDAEAKAAETEAELQKERDAKERAVLLEKAKSFKAGDPEKVADLLLRITKNKTTADDVKVVEEILKSAAALSDASLLFKSLGTPSAEGASAHDVILQKARALQEGSNGEVTFEKAYNTVLEKNPDLYKRYLEERT